MYQQVQRGCSNDAANERKIEIEAKTVEIHARQRVIVLLARAIQNDVKLLWRTVDEQGHARRRHALRRHIGLLQYVVKALIATETGANGVSIRDKARLRENIRRLVQELIEQQRLLSRTTTPRTLALSIVLEQIQQPGFGVCARCHNPLPVADWIDNPAIRLCSECSMG